MDFKIRKATLKDLKAIQQLNYALCKKEHEDFDGTIKSNFPLLEEGKRYFKERITKQDGCGFVAIVEGKVVGYLVGGMVEQAAWRNISKLAELENMFVLEKYRSSGIGAALCLAFQDWCRAKRVERLRVVISAQNAKAISFYKRVGYKDYDVALEKDR